MNEFGLPVIVCTEVMILQIALYIVCGISVLLTVILSLGTGKTLKNLLISSLLGFFVLLICTLFGKSFGVEVNFNSVTALLSLAGGLPGTVFAILLTLLI